MSESKAHAEGVFQGKVLAFLEQWKDFSASWVAHIASDEKNIREVRDEIATLKVSLEGCASVEDVNNLKIAMARYAGGAAILGALSGALIPIILQQVFK